MDTCAVAKRLVRPPELRAIVIDLSHHARGLFQILLEHEPIRDRRPAPQRDIRMTADPDRDRSMERGRKQRARAHAVELTLECDHLPTPEPAHQLDLFGQAPAALTEVDAERPKLLQIPTHANAQSKPPA